MSLEWRRQGKDVPLVATAECYFPGSKGVRNLTVSVEVLLPFWKLPGPHCAVWILSINTWKMRAAETPTEPHHNPNTAIQISWKFYMYVETVYPETSRTIGTIQEVGGDLGLVGVWAGETGGLGVVWTEDMGRVPWRVCRALVWRAMVGNRAVLAIVKQPTTSAPWCPATDPFLYSPFLQNS